MERLKLEPPTYEGPTGIVGVLHDACANAGMPSASLWAAVPHYVAVVPNPKGSLALLRRLESLIGITVDAAELEDAAGEYERQVSRAVEMDPDVQAFVEKLERTADEEEAGPDPSRSCPPATCSRASSRSPAPARQRPDIAAVCSRAAPPGTAPRAASYAAQGGLDRGPVGEQGRLRRPRPSRTPPRSRPRRRCPRRGTPGGTTRQSPGASGSGSPSSVASASPSRARKTSSRLSAWSGLALPGSRRIRQRERSAAPRLGEA